MIIDFTETYFFSGSRHNVGRLNDGGAHASKAVYIGAVGARFERRDPNPRMEWQEMVVSREQNVTGEHQCIT